MKNLIFMLNLHNIKTKVFYNEALIYSMSHISNDITKLDATNYINKYNKYTNKQILKNIYS